MKRWIPLMTLATLSVASALDAPQLLLHFNLAHLITGARGAKTPSRFPNTPMTQFDLPSACLTCHGRIFETNVPQVQRSIVKFFEEIERKNPQYSSYLFVHKNIVLQLDGELSEREADKFAEVLNKL